jgi:penicillin-binding protein 2
MPPQLDERRPPITPQLAVRVALLGGLAFALFAIVFFRLWFLQVLTGEEYVSQARENRVRKVRIEAPRGDIVDRNNRVLVRTKVAAVVQVVPSFLPDAVLAQADGYRRARSQAEKRRLAAARRLRALDSELRELDRRPNAPQRRNRRRLAADARSADPVAVPPVSRVPAPTRALYRRLGGVLDERPRIIHERVVEGIAETPYSNVTIETDVDRAAFNYLRERKELFPGISVEKQYQREYPFEELAAQLFGTLREVSPEELKLRRYRRLEPGTRIGASGIEKSYDRYLRGTDGYTRIIINSLGNRDDRREVARVEPRQGERLRLSLDLGLQRAANAALARAIAAAAVNGARAGAYVAMDPESGEILALGSYPSFDANVFAKPISQRLYERLSSEENGAPLFNRALAATYPTGSTFKPITAMAALEQGVVSAGDVIVDDGVFELGGREFKNAGDASYGALTLPDALRVSSDVFFYELGNRLNAEGPVLQEWARRLGMGRRTGIDVPGEFNGLIPDREWRDAGYEKYLECAKDAKVEPGTTAALFECGGIERPWSAGDNVNLAVGQGDLQATPLQLAVAYSTLANGGRVVRPHLGLAIEDGAGRLVEEIAKPARRHVDFDSAHREAIMAGLRAAATAPGGTSSDVFSGFPYPIYGKTGTAERAPNPDQSWYAVYVEHPTRPIVVVTTVERGGFGAETAAPAACDILKRWFHLRDFTCQAGTSRTR